MQRYFFKIFYFAMAVISIVALCKIFAGQVYARDPSVDSLRTVADNKNASSVNSTSWPFEMRLQMINYVCTTPSPNYDLTEEELIAAWQLPPKTCLSDRMRQIARCRLAAERISPSSDFDLNQCDCVDWWPIGLVVVPLILTACFYSFRFAFNLPMDKSQYGGMLYCISNVPFIFWFVAYWYFAFLNALKASNIGISYTIYGQLYPSYYFEQSADWKPIFDLVKVGYFASAVEPHFRLWLWIMHREAIKRSFVASSISCKRAVDEKKNNDEPKMIV